MQQDYSEDVTTPVLVVVLILVIGVLWALLVVREGKPWQQPLPCYLENAQYSNGALTYMFGSDADKPQPTMWQCVQGEWKPHKKN